MNRGPRELLEGDLAFDVRNVPDSEHFDHAAHGVDAFKKVDFVFEWEDEIWLVEVKDADDPAGRSAYDPDPEEPSERQQQFVEQFMSGTLIDRNLGPKARDSFLYLHLEGRFGPAEFLAVPQQRPIKYFVLFACAGLSAKALLTATKRLKRSTGMGGPHGRGFRAAYLKDCIVFDLEGWNRALGARVPVTRLSAAVDSTRQPHSS